MPIRLDNYLNTSITAITFKRLSSLTNYNLFALLLRKKSLYSELFWSIFSLIRTECGRENADQSNSEYGHFSHSDYYWETNLMQNVSLETSHKETCTRFLPRFRKKKLFFKAVQNSNFYGVKSVLIQSFSDPYFVAFRLNTERCWVSLSYSAQMRENTGQRNSEYGHFPGSV